MKKAHLLLLAACISSTTLVAQVNLGGLKNKVTTDKKKDTEKTVEKQSSAAASTQTEAVKDAPGTYYSATPHAVFDMLMIQGLGTDKISVKQFQYAGDKTPQKEFEMTKIASNVYNWHNILENDENKLLVVQPDGILTLLKVGKDFRSYNWTITLTTNSSEQGKLSAEKDNQYLNFAQTTAKDAYLKIKGGYAKEMSARISPLIKQLKPADDDAAALKMCQEAHRKLFNNPNFNIRDLEYVKAISTKADWKIVRDEITNLPLYRVRDYLVIAKSKTTGQCYAMYNSITQEYAGDWQTVRCSKESESGGFYVVGNDELKWGIANEIECF